MEGSDPHRDYLLALLDGWEGGRLTAADVRDAAEDLGVRLDWPPPRESGGQLTNDRSAPGSAIRHVVDALDSMHLSLVCLEDVDVLRALLRRGDDVGADDWKAWDAYWAHIDFVARGRALSGDPFYITSQPGPYGNEGYGRRST